ncbi:MAG: radical SAM family heme chaperone HemW [Candidatus Cloacimonetes bacterium]|nr:radical SAM family heme chaperone HemW [Candidatus Cloacimonadota bacterium]
MINSVYLHYPFCLRKCGYCSFYSVEYNREISKEYLKFIKQEIKKYHQIVKIKPRTIYLGGGTPSLMDIEDIQNVIELFDLSCLHEFTIEVNPATVNFAKLTAYRKCGINRISFGMQSFIDKELKLLGRLHNRQDNYQSFSLARDSGFNNISCDLIYGLPNQEYKDLRFNLVKVIELKPEHVSMYCLSLEDDAPLARNGTKLPNDEITAKFYRCIVETLVKAGYKHYEISNFSKQDFMSQHNLNYWKNGEYIGFGCSAHSYVDNYRYHNSSDLKSYYSEVLSKTIFPNKEKQDEAIKKKDFVIQGLRMTKGLDLESYKRSFREDFLTRYHKGIDKHKKFLKINNGYLKLTTEGFFVSNEIIIDLID